MDVFHKEEEVFLLDNYMDVKVADVIVELSDSGFQQ
jgi:hypothetical protein